ncbi:hypothetical protein ACS0TY_026024 [Phlomoides rotata]
MATDAHILAIPFPLQGHINPMLQLCHRLVSKRIRVTLLTTVSISKSLEKQAQDGNNQIINIETVPDSPTDDGVESLDVYDTFIRSFRSAITRGLADIIEKHSNTSQPLRAIVYGSVIPWILDIAHEKGLKGAALFTQPCTVNAIYYHMHKGSLDISPDDDRSEVSLPGMPAMGVKDLPSLVYDVDCYSAVLKAVLEQFSTLEKADWRLFNTFDKLEDEILKWMANKYPIQTIGPCVPSMYTDKRIPENYNYGLSFFKPETEHCLKWLDERANKSVIYVSFGSLANLSEKQMEEVAYGLLGSECNFLWTVRDTEQSKLPQYFTTRLMTKGLIVNWCVQLQVLAHRAVGCFFTHCGWNSTLEALSLGVPMVVMPQWTDQTTNGKLIADVWQIGVRVKADGDGIVGRENVAACINDVMHGETGRVIRESASKWKDLAVEAVGEGGSSDVNITEFATQLIAL